MLYEINGKAAMLEQTAEEAAELAQACLKLARYERMENPVYKTLDQLKADLVEEMVDVIICIDELRIADSLNSCMWRIEREKKRRMQERLKEIDEHRRATDEQIDT